MVLHRPVMLDEVIDHLNLKPGQIVLDATVGGGGHSGAILESIIPGGSLIGIEADPEAIARAEEALKGRAGNFKIINENFRNLDRVLANENVKHLDGVLFDLGVSSFQIDDKTRGFSIREDSKLDMRMDPRGVLTAYDIVNGYSEKDLSEILRTLGEERFHKRIARRIVEERSRRSVETTHELAAIVSKAAGFSYKRSRIDPATRTFQALRIAVNDELAAIEEGLKKAVSWMNLGARICVISFHSLEDRIAKRLFKAYAGLGVLKVITKKPLRPSEREMIENPRSRSGKLRVAERI